MQAHRRLVALRDFHAARHGPEMAAAAAALGATPLLGAEIDELEYAFNRLFVGPAAPLAPPYASAYLDPEHRLMGDVTGRVAAIYDAIGLRSPLSGSVPDDHIALELDAALAFGELLRGHGAARPVDAPLAMLWRYFVCEHLALWLPAFTARIESAGDVPPPLRHVNQCLNAWLAEETRALQGETPIPMTCKEQA